MKRLTIGLACAAAIVIAAGCGSSGEGTISSTPVPKDDVSGAIPGNESGFHPSDYGIEQWDTPRATDSAIRRTDTSGPASATEPDTVPGFRVQVMITQEIDRANAMKDSLVRVMRGEWIYIVYHPPYYKVRIGNYTDRFAADETLDRLRRNGLSAAWVVPDRIVRNPPPAPQPPDSTGPAEDSVPRR